MGFHFLMVNRGRYFCGLHGGFCDGADNYIDHCPLCDQKSSKPWEINKVDRALQIVGNIQKRSQRTVAIVTGLVGLIGALNVFKPGAAGGFSLVRNGEINGLILFSFCFLLFSIAIFIFSMSHMNVTVKSENGGTFDSMSLDAWELTAVKFVRRIESFHLWGNRLFLIGVLLLIIALFWQAIGEELYHQWQYKRMTS